MYGEGEQPSPIFKRGDIMYIEPNSTIKVLRGIPWDNTYQHTPRFINRTAQETYMNSKVAFTLGKHAYVREGRGYLKVEKNVEELIGCNYLMFQNPKPDGTMGKVFYAFITATEYINPVTTEIRYEIDVIQTWFLDCKLGQCFIERSHSATDKIGDNTVTEDISIGDYFCSQTENITNDIVWAFCAITGDLYYQFGAGGGWKKSNNICPRGGLPSMLNYTFFSLNSFDENEEANGRLVFSWSSAIRDLLDNHPNSTLALGIMPVNFYGENAGEPSTIASKNAYSLTKSFTWDTTKCFEGYASSIKNKKMFTFPYCCLELTNQQGDTAQYKYEYFNPQSFGAPSYTPKITFNIWSDPTPDPSILVAPKFYAGETINLDYTIHLTDFPFIGYTTDVYKNWLAMNKNQRSANYNKVETQMGMSAINGIVGTATSVATGNAVGAVNSIASGLSGLVNGSLEIDSLMAKEADLKARHAQPIAGKGSNLMFVNRNFMIKAKAMSLKWERAKRIDDYFSVYGYAERKIGTPNISSRPYWNYIKLANANITPINGGVPADDVSAIVRILSNGITFWHNPNNIGNYSLDNSV